MAPYSPGGSHGMETKTSAQWPCSTYTSSSHDSHLHCQVQSQDRNAETVELRMGRMHHGGSYEEPDQGTPQKDTNQVRGTKACESFSSHSAPHGEDHSSELSARYRSVRHQTLPMRQRREQDACAAAVPQMSVAKR